jgi:hypothetical protein
VHFGARVTYCHANPFGECLITIPNPACRADLDLRHLHRLRSVVSLADVLRHDRVVIWPDARAKTSERAMGMGCSSISMPPFEGDLAAAAQN